MRSARWTAVLALGMGLALQVARSEREPWQTAPDVDPAVNGAALHTSADPTLTSAMRALLRRSAPPRAHLTDATDATDTTSAR